MNDAGPAVLPLWREVVVMGHRSRYLVGGHGPTVVFLHGWGLAHSTYRRALDHLAANGVNVYAPAMPGFGGTRELSGADFTLDGYARWVSEFMRAVGIREPVTLVGHSFGGGVAIRTAHDFPAQVARLVLVNSIGGSAWANGRGVVKAMRERPIWDWGLHLPADVLPNRQATRVLPVILRDAVPNLLRNPRAVWRAGSIVRAVDLTAELDELKLRRLPVVIVWSKRDNVIPAAATESLRSALGDPHCVTVEGNHTWLLSDPRRFGEIITNVVGFEVLELPEPEIAQRIGRAGW
ncbi:alpha/beta fold hydrolase [Antrihabitans sp. YC2-6]|uniref:alpha/beta fold hydrolase n=1 Tax=Antrihabitans sp. YC2-6 TaxID=2799498 RepID=UPI0018F70F0B|nr:alpha/beta fold hydrolase [Antrihabitans sp. YC2-6]MBJ8347008.1 alpha/beta fold hydrolase [Antrihabitans sp. YC2-6]